MTKNDVKQMIFKQGYMVTENTNQEVKAENSEILRQLRANPMFLVNSKTKDIKMVDEGFLLDTLSELRHELVVNTFKNGVYVYDVQKYNHEATVEQ